MGRWPFRASTVFCGVCLISFGFAVSQCTRAEKWADPSTAVIDWLLENGGQVGLELATVNEDGLRGTVAARDFVEGDIVAAVPYNCSVELVPRKSSVTGPEMATQLLRKRFEDPAWWSHMQPHWDSLPGRSQIYNRHMFLPEHLPLLQDSSMVASVKTVLKNVNDVFNGASPVVPSRRYTSLAHLPGSADVTKEEFAYFAALMDSYSFSFPSDGEEEGEHPKVQLVPLLDLINHGDKPNIVLSRHPESSSYVATAVRPIRRGEEVVFEYNPSLARNDRALLNYFFVQERDPPLLCRMDLPELGSFRGTPGPPPRDDELYGTGGRFCTQEEVQRLTSILVSFPTTEDEDAALLDSGELTDWRERVIVNFRMLRKRALRLTIQGLHAALAAAAQKAIIVPNLGASEDLQEPIFLDADAAEEIAAAAAAMRGAVISARRAGMLGWDPTLMPADSSKPEVNKMRPVRPMIGAKDVLDSPKMIHVSTAELVDV
ncbi:hypothetical protein COCOBI_06-5720 [Coccomyxa sp. Obi]|nr:hypothetical protein COCOBI_06-5720 [Coccomyxa sp. Obi]